MNSITQAKAPRRYLSRSDQAKRYSKSVRTIKRWGKDPDMNMPPEYDLNGHLHRLEHDLELWERSRVAPKSVPAA